MPELPEVETVRRGLDPAMNERRIVAADVRRPDLRWPLPARMAERLTGARVLALRRRSKYILADLDPGETLLVHLGMSGRMLVLAPCGNAPHPIPPHEGEGAARPRPLGTFHAAHPAPSKHDHVILDMEGGARIVFNDARRFGAMDLVATAAAEAHPLLAGLGPEPLGNHFHESYLVTRLKGRRMPVKAALMDQRVVAGLGNIYVCETLWRAGIAPARRVANIAERRLAALVPAIREVLTEAIAAGGSSLRDYRQASGELGYFQHAFSVYDRAGEPCRKPGCRGTIRRRVQAGRSSYHCPACQR